MKKLLLSIVLAAFATMAHAGSDKKCADDAGCCSMMTTGSQTKTDCQGKATRTTAKAAKTTASTRTALKSPKALG